MDEGFRKTTGTWKDFRFFPPLLFIWSQGVDGLFITICLHVFFSRPVQVSLGSPPLSSLTALIGHPRSLAKALRTSLGGAPPPQSGSNLGAAMKRVALFPVRNWFVSFFDPRSRTGDRKKKTPKTKNQKGHANKRTRRVKTPNHLLVRIKTTFFFF